MAESKSTVGLAIPGALAMAVVTAIVSASLYFSPLHSDRPNVPTGMSEPLGYQDVPARLWQDPFDAAAHAAKPRADNAAREGESIASQSAPAKKSNTSSPGDQAAVSHNIGDLWDQLNEHNQEGDAMILAVMVPAAQYSELAEQRLRTRVAVLNGLARCGLEPLNNDHIGFVRIPWPTVFPLGNPPRLDLLLDRAVNSKPTSDSLLLPYEWFKRMEVPSPQGGAYSNGLPDLSFPLGDWDRKTAKSVLLVWLNEDAMSDKPLIRLEVIVKALRNGQSPATPIMTRIIGPKSSTTLRLMAKEAAEEIPMPSSDLPLDPSVEIYSQAAQASSNLLLDGLTFKQSQPESIADAIHKATGATFYRVTIPDDVLCCSLKDELKLRCGDRSKDFGDIAIISEWDTFYGRALPETFTVKTKGTFTKVWTYYYLRGIDGLANGENTAAAAATQNGNEQGKTAPGSRLQTGNEPPEGTPQLDYLRRLADSIARKDAILKHQGHGLTAVGILGTDVYDKLLILRAMRDQLPDKVFFTTGMDARYALPSEWPATHNLVTISPFGLSLADYYQGNVQPFRDSVQTATFTATLMALGAFHLPIYAGTDSVATAIKKHLGDPQRFEIARFGPIDLTVDSPVNDPHEEPGIDSLVPPPTVQPQRIDYSVRWPDSAGSWFKISLLCVALLVVPIFVFKVRPSEFSFKALLVWLPLILGIVLAACLAIFGPRWQGERSEPMALIQGDSVWPTECARCVALGLIWTLLLRMWEVNATNDKQMEKDFLLKPISERKLRESGNVDAMAMPLTTRSDQGRALFFNNWKVYGRPGNGKSPRASPVDERTVLKKEPEHVVVYAQNLWWEYQLRGHPLARLARTVGLSAAYFGMTYIFGQEIIGGLGIPARGSFAYDIDRLLIKLSSPSIILLTFWVLDAAYLNVRFIRLLTKMTTHWPPRTFEKFDWKGVNLGVDLTEYIDICFIAARTDAVGEAIYYPFYAFFIMLVARNSLFANWAWGFGLTSVLLLTISLAILAALILRRAAEAAREDALAKIGRRIECYVPDAPKYKILSELLGRVRNERRGAFSILSRHPLLAAVILPSGSVGVYALLEYLAQSIH